MLANFFLHASILLQITALLYVLAAVLYLASLFIRNKFFNMLTLAVFSGGFVFNVAFFIDRWVEAGRAPIKSQFEAFMLLTMTVALLSIIVEMLHKVRAMGLFCSLTNVVILLLAFSSYETLIQNLPAALQSYWFIPHVVVYFFGYAAAAVSFFSGVLYIFFPQNRQLKENNLLNNMLGQKIIDFEAYTYHLIVFSFVMLGLGLIMGALWAKEAWGVYWAWDPKENWALISFFVYSLYLHFRLLHGWRGKPATWFAIIGFIAIAITFVGVSYLPSAKDSMHVYLE